LVEFASLVMPCPTNHTAVSEILNHEGEQSSSIIPSANTVCSHEVWLWSAISAKIIPLYYGIKHILLVRVRGSKIYL